MPLVSTNLFERLYVLPSFFFSHAVKSGRLLKAHTYFLPFSLQGIYCPSRTLDRFAHREIVCYGIAHDK